MTKGNRKYIVILGLCFSALIAMQLLAPKPINWKFSYTKKDKIPFGASALYEMLPALFPGQEISDKIVPLYNSLNKTDYANSNYIIINNQIEIDKLDLRELLGFVRNGNNVFIAANYFGKLFADTLNIETGNFFNELSNNLAVDSGSNIYSGQPSVLNFVNPAFKKEHGYIYEKGFKDSYFTSFDTSNTVALGISSNKRINFISVQKGKGHLFLSTVPEAFSNYHFTDPRNNEYACKALSYLPNQPLIWDEYYKAGNTVRQSPLRVILSHPALEYAYYLLIISLLLFMIIGIKRKQRIIPVIEPLNNTTLQFVETVGSLYYQSGDHKNLATKKITYFLEYIRTNFHIKTTSYDAEFIEKISNLSGIEKEKISDLFSYFAGITAKQKITQQELLLLNKKIEEFHSLNKR